MGGTLGMLPFVWLSEGVLLPENGWITARGTEVATNIVASKLSQKVELAAINFSGDWRQANGFR